MALNPVFLSSRVAVGTSQEGLDTEAKSQYPNRVPHRQMFIELGNCL